MREERGLALCLVSDLSSPVVQMALYATMWDHTLPTGPSLMMKRYDYCILPNLEN
jgi:hypothetical protein